MYTVTNWLQIGIEYNPKVGEVGPLANIRFLEEKDLQPAIIAGTSSDRIGTPKGTAFGGYRSYYITASKSLEKLLKIPVAPYVGAAYGTFENDLRVIAGGNILLMDRLSTTHLYDGKKLHHILNVGLAGNWNLGFLVVKNKYVGFTTGIGFKL